MNLHWKIFNVINLICLTLVISLFVQDIFNFSRSLDDISDVFSYVVVCLIPIIVVTNCLHNISLTKIYTTGEKLTSFRKVYFWILLSLFLIIVFGAIFQFIFGLTIKIQYSGYYQAPFIYRILLQLLSVSITGLYIIVMQLRIFFKIKSSSRQELDNSINQLGT
jgi:hypothetical protein